MQQGDLDASCGLYAGIHACQIAAAMHDEVLPKVLHLIISCDEFGLPETVVRNLLDPTVGTTFEELGCILEKMVGVINKYRKKYNLDKSKTLSVEPFDIFDNTRGNIKGAFTRVHELFEQAKNDGVRIAMVIGIPGHWTVIESASKAQWEIVDSGTMLQMKLAHWTASKAEGVINQVDGSTYVIRFDYCNAL